MQRPLGDGSSEIEVSEYERRPDHAHLYGVFCGPFQRHPLTSTFLHRARQGGQAPADVRSAACTFLIDRHDAGIAHNSICRSFGRSEDNGVTLDGGPKVIQVVI